MLLVDSGAQYLDGTTDVTRTMAIGEPSPGDVRALHDGAAGPPGRWPVCASRPAPRGRRWTRSPGWRFGRMAWTTTTAPATASAPTWASTKAHTGSPKLPNFVALRPGMIVSNEPGYYKEGAYGIRIETLQFVTEAAMIPGGERAMLGFETLTMAPIDRRLVVKAMLTATEISQLDAYHARVLAVVGPQAPADVAAWLAEVCAPI